jgi:ribosomal-protein-alanine N-acetyltransferase
VTLRPATADDVAAVHALEQELFGREAWSAESVREELTGPRRTAVVACDPGLEGYAVSAVAGDVVDLQRIAVHPHHRRCGLAHRLLVEVAPPDVVMLLEVGAANQAGLAFYRHEGFVEIDRRPRYYRDGSDAVVMRRAPRR